MKGDWNLNHELMTEIYRIQWTTCGQKAGLSVLAKKGSATQKACPKVCETSAITRERSIFSLVYSHTGRSCVLNVIRPADLVT